jgi:hypothetical protein
LKLNGKHRLLVYADDGHTRGGKVHNLKENTKALVDCKKEIGLEVNADKTKYTIMSRDQNAGRRYNVKIDNSSYECLEELKYLGTASTNQNSILWA